ncbi:hypothetical protein PC121_g7433 [Phytophthora cactorum]|nr:hypothetical protein PC121_g7433 [Phytophthora cactorum]
MEGDNWKTGKPLVEEGFATEMMDAEIDNSTLRRELRYRNGMTTRWEHEGLVCDVRAQIMGRLAQARKQRAGIGGELIHQTAAELSYKTIVPRDAEGNVRKWAVYKAFAAEHDVRLFKDLVEITYVSPGKLLFQPRTMEVPMESKVSHGMEDPHHSFRIDQEDEHGKVVHGLSFTEQPVPMGNSMEEMEANIEALLGAPTGSVWATPHPALTHMRPLWAGKRRWTQTRKKYKAIIGRTRSHKAAQEQELTRVKGDLKHKELNYALKQLPWKNAHRLHGVTAYLKQNIVKMKAWRLRLWRGKEHKYRCAGTSCRHGSEGPSLGMPRFSGCWGGVVRRMGYATGTKRGEWIPRAANSHLLVNFDEGAELAAGMGRTTQNQSRGGYIRRSCGGLGNGMRGNHHSTVAVESSGGTPGQNQLRNTGWSNK